MDLCSLYVCGLHAGDGLENQSVSFLHLSHVHNAVDEQRDVALELEMRREEEQQMKIGKRTGQVAISELDEDVFEVFSRPENQTICRRERRSADTCTHTYIHTRRRR